MPTFHAVKIAAQAAVLRKYGFELPTARRMFSWRTPERTREGVMGTLGLAGKWGGEMLRQHVLGDPYTMYRELRNTIHRSGNVPAGLVNHARQYYYRKPTNAMQWLSNGVSLYGIGNSLTSAALTQDPEQRKGDLAVAATQIATAPFTSRLGLLGTAVQPLLNRKVRQLFQRNPEASHPIPYNPFDHAKATLRGVGVADDSALQSVT